ncbi:SH3 domain-binding protein 5, partial [Teladorsagia circumcincta]
MPEVESNDALRILDIGKGTSKALSTGSDSCAGSMLNYSEIEDDDTPLDQKHLNLVHEELEKLNIATDVINKLEVQLDGARACFREIQACWSEKLKDLSKKYSSAIAKARPYYEAKIQVLNHHIQRVNEAEKERVTSGNEHRAISERLMTLADQIRKMEKDQRSSIKKSRTYFDQRLEFTRVLERQKELILRLEAEVRQKKCDYTTSLRNLERISDSIHEQRSIGGYSARDPPANPPPYQPTAPPPYEEDDGRYAISHEA